jgi:ABC-type glycerol-3-phosphate transport system substrate-binding protein
MINIFSVKVNPKYREKKMKRILIVSLTAMVLITACGGTATGQLNTAPERDELVTIYKTPT